MITANLVAWHPSSNPTPCGSPHAAKKARLSMKYRSSPRDARSPLTLCARALGLPCSTPCHATPRPPGGARCPGGPNGWQLAVTRFRPKLAEAGGSGVERQIALGNHFPRPAGKGCSARTCRTRSSCGCSKTAADKSLPGTWLERGRPLPCLWLISLRLRFVG